MEDGEEVLIDIDSKTRFEIHDHLKKIICKTELQITKEEIPLDVPEPSDFGWGCDRECMCEVPGQVPCPGVIPLPDLFKKKHNLGFAMEEE